MSYRYTARDPYTSLPAPVSVFPGGSKPTPGQCALNLYAAGYVEPGAHEAERPLDSDEDSR